MWKTRESLFGSFPCTFEKRKRLSLEHIRTTLRKTPSKACRATLRSKAATPACTNMLRCSVLSTLRCGILEHVISSSGGGKNASASQKSGVFCMPIRIVSLPTGVGEGPFRRVPVRLLVQERQNRLHCRHHERRGARKGLNLCDVFFVQSI